ncbi:MAG: hypothetical protein IKN96_05960 [Oscillibacter sp.]|nr:hypothetical protein [Oscillibacter sp.]
MIITRKRVRGAKPTPEQIAMIEAAKKLPVVFDEDCPEMTEEQLRQFKPANPRADAARKTG